MFAAIPADARAIVTMASVLFPEAALASLVAHAMATAVDPLEVMRAE